jgi:hypothetical protein
MSQDTDNRREFSRVPVTMNGRVCLKDGPCFHGHLVDLSLGGVLFAAEHELREGECVVVEVLRGDTHSLSLVCADGLVGRRTEAGTAIAFTGMDIESHDALRALVLAYTDDPVRVVEEFRDHPRRPRRDKL